MDLSKFSATEADVSGLHQATTDRKKRKGTVTRLDLPRAQSGEKFIKGPIPLDWLQAAARCGRRGEAVALLLWYAAGWQKVNPIKLTPTILMELYVHPKSARRILVKFQEAGLVSVEFHRGRSPLVTLLSRSLSQGGSQ